MFAIKSFHFVQRFDPFFSSFSFRIPITQSYQILTLLQYLSYQTQFQAAGIQNRYLDAAGKRDVD